MYDSNKKIRSVPGTFKKGKRQVQLHAFTLVEVAAAIALLSIIFGSILTLMNRYALAMRDLQLTQEAFELARGNMEQLLTETKLSDRSEFGDSETNPAIEWETLVEPFYEPVTNEMWIRAVCSSEYTDSKGTLQTIVLEHWITNLSAEQVKKISNQQALEKELEERPDDCIDCRGLPSEILEIIRKLGLECCP